MGSFDIEKKKKKKNEKSRITMEEIQAQNSSETFEIPLHDRNG